MLISNTPFKGKTFNDGEWVFGQMFQTKRSNTSEYDWWTDSRDNKGRRRGDEIVTIISPSPLSLSCTVTGDPYIDTDVFPIVNPETICRCTGLTDKNNKLIFENDILKFGNRALMVWWNEECFQWQARAFKKDCELPIYEGGFCDYEWDNTTLGWIAAEITILGEMSTEIIGNIFDTPELLEDKNDNTRVLCIKNSRRADSQVLTF